MGMVRQLAGLAHEVWKLLIPIFFNEEALPAVVPGLDLGRLLTFHQQVTHSEFERIIRPYPRFVGINPDHDGPYESEFILFADMLRFVWVHEWVHGFAGHSRFLRQGFGLGGLGEVGAPESASELASIRRASNSRPMPLVPTYSCARSCPVAIPQGPSSRSTAT
jgi:hypothetical protein